MDENQNVAEQLHTPFNVRQPSKKVGACWVDDQVQLKSVNIKECVKKVGVEQFTIPINRRQVTGHIWDEKEIQK